MGWIRTGRTGKVLHVRCNETGLEEYKLKKKCKRIM